MNPWFSAALCYLPTLCVANPTGDFPTPFNTDPLGKDGPVMTAQQAAASFRLPEGFQVQVVAAEPDVQNPIAMTWDDRGRLWVAENYTYAERKVRFEMGLRDRVLVLEDHDEDGTIDKRTVFTDTVQMLTSVETGHGGVWLMCPPQLLFIPDRDGDLVPDGPPEVKLDGFTVAKGNYHNYANGLRWGPDGWLYGRCGHSCPGTLGVPGTPKTERLPIDGGIWRYHPTRDVVEVLCHGTVNPWGHDWNDTGELFFINTVIGHLWHMIPGAHYKESSGASQNPRVFDRMDQHADHYHYDRGQHWTKSRDGAANDLGGGHAHIGMTIYQGGHFPPAWNGKLLTWNMHGRRANVERLERSGSGYLGRHEPDAFLSGDPWFRGIDLRTGPDGALYAIDWSDTGECHEHTGVHRTSGRIFRFTYGDIPRPAVSPSQSKVIVFAPHTAVKHPNAWVYRTALRQTYEHAGRYKDVPSMGKHMASSKDAADRLRGLWMMHAIQALNPYRLLEDHDEHLRVWGLRLMTDTWPLDTLKGQRPARPEADLSETQRALLRTLATDPSGLVRLAVASTLQRMPHEHRAEIATVLASHPEDQHDPNLPFLVWYGIMPLVDTDPAALVTLATDTPWPQLRQWIARALAMEVETRPGPVEQLLELAASTPDTADPILAGLTEGWKGWVAVPKPGNWDSISGPFATHPQSKPLAALFGDEQAINRLTQIVNDGKENPRSRKQAMQALVRLRPEGLRELCETHLGSSGIAPEALKGLATFDDPAIADLILTRYAQGHSLGHRAGVFDVLTSRPSWARTLLQAIASKKIPRDNLSPYHARHIEQLGDASLTALLHRVWGRAMAKSEAHEKRIAALRKELTPETLARADLESGKKIYTRTCAPCHQLHGTGGKVGPDLTGSGRHDLDYLLENILAPSAVVSADYLLTVVVMQDGRVVSGMTAGETPHTLTLRLIHESTTLPKSEIEERKVLPISLMPEGLIDGLTPGERRDLIGFLMGKKDEK